jgi:group I intron endonuclease
MKDVMLRWKQHRKKSSGCTALKNAINKYGWEHFTKSIIDWAPENELDDLERYYIKLHNSMAPNGYNLTVGGDGGSLAEVSKKKISTSMKKFRANRPQFGCVSFLKTRRLWKAASACPASQHIGYYFTEKKAREALDHYNNTGEQMESDRKTRKNGTGSFSKHYGRYQASIEIDKKRHYKTFDTVKQCEEWLLNIGNNIL